ncbi:MAG: Lrp/AsnC ligand binding domain-containing protein [Acidobacteriota bacterium]|nr:Lrp/AsnC ligand binding domain-containing protein [Blastocatellia bacterium]MDW8238463.1 Lrp/AsnC ligand binding domain-containing protein [Acidobacteriota bacterium]
MPLSAYIFLETEPGKTPTVIKRVARIPGVRQAHVVTGPYDIIVFVEANDTSELVNMIVKKIQGISGVTRTLTSVVL